MKKVSVSMIAWNEATTIDLALKAVKDIADEVVLVDSGSWDGTQDIARRCFEEFGIDGKVLYCLIRICEKGLHVAANLRNIGIGDSLIRRSKELRNQIPDPFSVYLFQVGENAVDRLLHRSEFAGS